MPMNPIIQQILDCCPTQLDMLEAFDRISAINIRPERKVKSRKWRRRRNKGQWKLRKLLDDYKNRGATPGYS